MEWIKIGTTPNDEYPDDGTKDVQLAKIKDDKIEHTWIGRNAIMTVEGNRVTPTHWCYIEWFGYRP